MANNCGSCLLFKGQNQKCGATGRSPIATTPAGTNCFKGPASLFKTKVCGSCRGFNGPSKKCPGGKTPVASAPANKNCYSPNPG